MSGREACARRSNWTRALTRCSSPQKQRGKQQRSAARFDGIVEAARLAPLSARCVSGMAGAAHLPLVCLSWNSGSTLISSSVH